MGKSRRIGLIGFTGTGKSTVSAHLNKAHGFQVVGTGQMCRTVSRLVFGNEDKANLTALTDALQTIDPAIFLKAALRDKPSEDSLVIDALRFMPDYHYATSRAFHLIRLQAPLELRRHWLTERGQIFDFETDGKHPSETELMAVSVNTTLINDGTKAQLLEKVDELINGL